ncbi:hypothetical protein UCREL1_8046 [Eutypa lata UCREL1]|uniref:Uncharacterized protein n=1 Tax=Eutypa lata (strain UCR-EL1) TaxID=1287681 RepID=M7TE63_EUTLA|nr:hypothetical protein UCREL1_8046 [Eutypa lata UCREL1]
MASLGNKVQGENVDDGSMAEVNTSVADPLSNISSLPIRPSATASNTPTINIDLLLSPPTHCFTRESAPIITLKLTLLSTPSSSSGPITLYTEKTPLDIRYTLSHRGFTIRDLSTESQELVNTTFVGNAQRMACPRLRVRGCREEPYFITLYPYAQHLSHPSPSPSTNTFSSPSPTPISTSTPEAPQQPTTIELSYTFGRHIFRPQPWSIVQLGREIDEAGNPRNIRRSRSVTGVDGLEPGHEYEVGMDVEALRKSVMWAPVPKEDILLERGYRGPGMNLLDYAWIRDRPLDFRVGTVRLRVLEEEEEEEEDGPVTAGVSQ